MAAYAESSSDHSELDAPETGAYEEVSKIYKDTFIEQLSKPSVIENLKEKIASNLVDRDLEYLVDMDRRPFSEDRTSRDRYSSFVIDFDILHKGTGPWTWEAIPQAYKDMWKEIVETLTEETFKDKVMKVIHAYKVHHPHLLEEDTLKINEFTKKFNTSR